MHRRQASAPETLRVAARQAGVVSRTQAIASGTPAAVIDRLAREGAWPGLGRGVYATRTGDPGWLSLVWAAVLMGGSTARAAGRTAAGLHGLTDVRALPLSVLVAAAARPSDREWVTYRRERDGVRLPSWPTEPCRTRIDDTVLDLVAEGSAQDAIGWVTAAVQRRLVSPQSLSAAADRRPRLAHRALLADLVADVSGGVESPLEYRYHHDVEQAHGLPTATRQLHLGRRYADAAYVEFALLVELDGLRWHNAGADRRRDNEHARLLWVTLRFGWSEIVSDPCRVAREVASVLAVRGWTGKIRSCRRCVETCAA